jgi:hypothetical protein
MYAVSLMSPVLPVRVRNRGFYRRLCSEYGQANILIVQSIYLSCGSVFRFGTDFKCGHVSHLSVRRGIPVSGQTNWRVSHQQYLVTLGTCLLRIFYLRRNLSRYRISSLFGMSFA